MPLNDNGFDYDWVVIGSGFGGSVAALRLAERGYSVAVLECGRRWATEDLPETTWNLRKYFWIPGLGLRGILRMTFFRNISIVSGAGVGGGSLVYSQTLYRAGATFRERLNTAVGAAVDLDPYYEIAEFMLGVVDTPRKTSRDAMIIATAEELGISADRYRPTRIGVFFGTEPGVTVPDPYFGGEGPARAGCIECGRCMVGCRHNAKNSLDKNYLYLAERRGARVLPERLVTDIRPIGAADGADGYEIRAHRPGAWIRKRRTVLRARGVVLAAGTLGTNRLLAACRRRGSLPALSERVGRDVRTNAESMGAIMLRDRSADLTDGVALTGSLLPTDDLHFQWAQYGGGGDAMGALFLPLTGAATRMPRPLQLLRAILVHPWDFLRSRNVFGWSRHSMIVAAMWNHDGIIQLQSARRWFGGLGLRARVDPANPLPTSIPPLNDFIEHMAEKYDAVPQLWASESFGIPFTAHILGGAILGTDPANGLIDGNHRVFGYRNLLITDGSAVPYNPGVNPSLTIAALAERALAAVPAKDGTIQKTGIGYRPSPSPTGPLT